jgi:hypothetical protein
MALSCFRPAAGTPPGPTPRTRNRCLSPLTTTITIRGQALTVLRCRRSIVLLCQYLRPTYRGEHSESLWGAIREGPVRLSYSNRRTSSGIRCSWPFHLCLMAPFYSRNRTHPGWVIFLGLSATFWHMSDPKRNSPPSVRTFTTSAPIKACRLRRDDLARLYRIINDRQVEYGKTFVNQVLAQQPSETPDQFHERQARVMNAFVTTVNVTGSNKEIVSGSGEHFVTSEIYPTIS